MKYEKTVFENTINLNAYLISIIYHSLAEIGNEMVYNQYIWYGRDEKMNGKNCSKKK